MERVTMMTPGLLKVLDTLPAGILDVEPSAIGHVLSGPTLIHLPGRRPRPLFVSAFLHGNETTGFLAMQRVLKQYSDRLLPRALSLFFGNIPAAIRKVRRLDQQCDYNRIWPGTELPVCPEIEMAQWIADDMARRRVFASIDIHNNTGLNPHYSCVSHLQRQSLQLAAMFGRLCIYSTRPKGTQTGAFAPLCPALTLECGKPGVAFGSEHAAEFIDACLHISQLRNHRVPMHDLELYESVAQIFINTGIDFGFGKDDADLNLIPDLDRLNFRPVSSGFAWGEVSCPDLPITVLNGDGRNVADLYFRIEDGQLYLTQSLMPSMLTLDERVIRQDCLGYLMTRMSLAEGIDRASASPWFS
jgi:succinylglutamate desuccinylase